MTDCGAGRVTRLDRRGMTHPERGLPNREANTFRVIARSQVCSGVPEQADFK